MIFINFKTYEEGTGAKAVSLALEIAKVSLKSGVKIVPVVQATDIREIATGLTLEVWSQKIDPIEYGANTGGILPEAILEDGASGVFLNHSENRFDGLSELEKAVRRCSELDLKTLVFAGNLAELKQVIELKPTFVSYEPPELVGNPSTSVARESPEIIKQAVDLARQAGLPLIVGAGIKSAEDIKTSLDSGVAGFAVSSSIVKAADPKEALLELIKGYE